MIPKRNILKILTFVLLLSRFVMAQNADFTFHVPIDMQDLHYQVDKIAVQLHLFNGPSEKRYSFYKDPTRPHMNNEGEYAHRLVQYIQVPTSTGNVKQTVTFKFNMENPETIKSYSVAVNLHNAATNEWTLRCDGGEEWCIHSGNYQPDLIEFGKL